MSRRLTMFFGALALTLSAGCGTISQIHNDWEGPAVFGGVRYWIQAISADEEHDRLGIMGSDVAGGIVPSAAEPGRLGGNGLQLLVLQDYVVGGGSYLGGLLAPPFDLPFSLLGDLIMLPFAAINELYHGGITVRPPPAPSPLAESGVAFRD